MSETTPLLTHHHEENHSRHGQVQDEEQSSPQRQHGHHAVDNNHRDNDEEESIAIPDEDIEKRLSLKRNKKLEKYIFIFTIIIISVYIISQFILGGLQQKVNQMDIELETFNITTLTQNGIKVDIHTKSRILVTPLSSQIVILQSQNLNSLLPSLSFFQWPAFGLSVWPETELAIQLANLEFDFGLMTKKVKAEIKPLYFYIPPIPSSSHSSSNFTKDRVRTEDNAEDEKDQFLIRFQAIASIFGFKFPTWNYLNDPRKSTNNEENKFGSISGTLVDKKFETVQDPESNLPQLEIELKLKINNTSPLIISASLSPSNPSSSSLFSSAIPIQDVTCLISYKFVPIFKVKLNSIALYKGINPDLKTVLVTSFPHHMNSLNEFLREYSEGEDVQLTIHGCSVTSTLDQPHMSMEDVDDSGSSSSASPSLPAWLNRYLDMVSVTVHLPPPPDNDEVIGDNKIILDGNTKHALETIISSLFL